MIYKNTFPRSPPRWDQILRWKLHLGPREENQSVLTLDPPEKWLPIKPNLKAIHEPNPEKIQVTWIGHSTFLIQHRQRNILTDPIFGDCLTPVPGIRLRRASPPGLTFDQLPTIHEVLISHNHYDHLDSPTVQRLAKSSTPTRFWLPAGLNAWFRKKQIANVRELAWWESSAFAGAMEIHAVPAQHFAARGPFDRNHTHWCGWVWRSGNRKIYFAGDSGYSSEFKAIGAHFGGMDVSLIPIGAYNPRWIMRSVHTNPAEAVQIHQDVCSRLSIACHWGTFRLTDEPLHEPPALLNESLARHGLAQADFRALSPGESVVAEPAGEVSSVGCDPD
jgi:N-acyl-phosphatidylethanolamine-hydrolysing phospholipase D